MMSSDEIGAKSARVARGLLAVSCFFFGMWLAKDSSSAFLQSDIEATIKVPTTIAAATATVTSASTSTTSTLVADAPPKQTGGVPKWLLTKPPVATRPPAPETKEQDDNNDIDNENENKQDDQYDDLPSRFCNGLRKVHTPQDEKNGFSLRYKCVGPMYNQFAKTLQKFADKERKNHNPLWGKRGIPANQTYLILGSSHLQQVAT